MKFITAIKNFFSRRRTPAPAISLYAVFDHLPPTLPDGSFDLSPAAKASLVPLTFTASPSQALAAVDALLYYKYVSHFAAWLRSARHLQTPPSISSPLWDEYRVSVLSNIATHDFHVLRLSYSLPELASFFRTFADCSPLFLPFEQPSELLHYMASNSSPDGTRVILPSRIIDALELDPLFKSTVEAASNAAFDFSDSIS